MDISYLADDTFDEPRDVVPGPTVDFDAFRTVFDASPQGVMVHRLHKPLYVNHAWAALHGYETGEILARETIVDLISLEDRERLIVYNNDRLAGCPAPTRYHYQLVQKNEKLRWVEIFVQQLEWFGEPAIQCTVIDARARDDTLAERLRRAEDTNEKFLSALEESMEGFALYGEDHRLLVWNRRFVEMVPELDGLLKPGMTFEQVARIRLDHGTIAGALGHEDAWLEERLRSFGKFDSWIDMQNPEGRWCQVIEKRLNDGCILITVIDITERRQAQEALASERTLLRTIIDNIPEAIFAKDLETKFIVKNRFDAELMGAVMVDETIGKTDFDYYPDDVASQFYEEDRQVIENGETIVAKEQPFVCRHDGSQTWLSTTKAPLRNADGEIIGLVGCTHNITDRKLIELDLARVAERTAEIARQRQVVEDALDKERELNALQRQFVSMVCHEFRTPLAIIDGNAQRMLRLGREDRLQPGQLTVGMDKIRISVQRLTDLMETVLNAARLEAGTIKFEPKPCSPTEMIAEICANYRDVNPTYEIIENLDRLPEQFSMDVQLMRQVVSNLLSNAVKYSQDGSSIWVAGMSCDNGAITISIRDEGFGIPEAELERLFERFFRASSSTGIAGTGIGLNMVKALVDIHGGHVDVASEEGKGTTFSVHLPRRHVEMAVSQKSA